MIFVHNTLITAPVVEDYWSGVIFASLGYGRRVLESKTTGEEGSAKQQQNSAEGEVNKFFLEEDNYFNVIFNQKSRLPSRHIIECWLNLAVIWRKRGARRARDRREESLRTGMMWCLKDDCCHTLHLMLGCFAPCATEFLHKTYVDVERSLSLYERNSGCYSMYLVCNELCM